MAARVIAVEAPAHPTEGLARGRAGSRSLVARERGRILATMILEMTPEQLAAYRATRRRRESEEAARRSVRVDVALRLAREAAQVLRADFGATDVLLFGSLAEGGFGAHSDIDLAARGLGAAHYGALGRLLMLSPDFEFDLVDLDTCTQGLRDAVEHHGVAL